MKINNKFKFSPETILLFVAFFMEILADIIRYAHILTFNEQVNMIYDLIYLPIYILLVVGFANINNNTKIAKNIIGIAFLFKLLFIIKDMLYGYVIYNNSIEIFYFSIYIIAIIGNGGLVLYWFNKLKNKKVYCIFITMLLLNSVAWLIDPIRYTLIFPARYNLSSLLFSFAYLLTHIAALVFIMPTKKKKQIEKEQTLAEKLKSLQQEFERNNITQEEYALRKKEYLSHL